MTVRHIDSFCDALVPEPCTDATTAVFTVDGKGVATRPQPRGTQALRDATAKAATTKAATTKGAAAKGGNATRTRLAAGRKPGRRRMAALAAVRDAGSAARADAADAESVVGGSVRG